MADRKKSANWETEIKRIMRHFCMKEEANEIIAEVKSSANGDESDDVLYDRAWRRFKTLVAS